MDTMIGRMLGAYQVTEQLGRGGMAAVYKAYHAPLNRYVAIKVLPEYFAHDPTFFDRFQQEAQAVARMRHPHIMQIFDFGRDGDLTYLVMEYVDGGTLQERLGKPLPIADALHWARHVADALGYAHARGIVHRDVKPSNILLTKDGEAVLSDFGIAKMVERAVSLTKTGVGVGTPEYMAPEQGQGLAVDGRTDIYSLGVVLYEMMTGQVPYIAETPLAIVLKHMNEPLQAPRLLNPALPDVVQALVLTCLAKDPAGRYQAAADLIRAIDDISAAGLASSPQAMTMPESPAVRRTPPPAQAAPPAAYAPTPPPPGYMQMPAGYPATPPPGYTTSPAQAPGYGAATPPPGYAGYPPQYGYPGAYGQAPAPKAGLSGALKGGLIVLALVGFGALAVLAGFALRDRVAATATPTSAALAVAPSTAATSTAAVQAPAPAGSLTATAAPAARTPAAATPIAAPAGASSVSGGATASATALPAAPVPATAAPTLPATPVAATATPLRPSATPAPATAAPAAAVASPTATPAPAPGAFSGRIAFTNYHGPSRYGDFAVMVMSVPGGAPRQIFDRGSEPTFSPDGTRILFYNWNASGFFVMNTDGSGLQRISTSSEDAYPSWSRDGKRIVFSLFENRYNIWVMNADGSGRRKVFDGGEQPSFAPDAGRIVLKGCIGGNCGLLICNADGGAPRLLTTNANDSSPSWSPGGSTIVFTSDRSGTLDVWTISPDGTNLRQLTSSPTSDGAATWSPDGNFIYFRSDRDGSWGIYEMTDTGGNQHKVVGANVSERWWWERISVSW